MNLQPALTLASRDILGSSSTGSISATAIVLIIFVAIVPVFIVGGVTIWLLGYYGRSGGCCCCGRKKKDKTAHGRTPSQEPILPFNEKTPAATTETAHWRPTPENRVMSPVPSTPSRVLTREDTMSRHSHERVPALPKGFV